MHLKLTSRTGYVTEVPNAITLTHRTAHSYEVITADDLRLGGRLVVVDVATVEFVSKEPAILCPQCKQNDRVWSGPES
jgi:hypothetical protein